MRTKLPEKLYYSIGEIAESFNVNPSLIRFWEKEFEILTPKKNNKGTRKFTSQDIDKIELIYFLVKERGFTLEGRKKKYIHKTAVNTKLFDDSNLFARNLSRLEKTSSYFLRINISIVDPL